MSSTPVHPVGNQDIDSTSARKPALSAAARVQREGSHQQPGAVRNPLSGVD